MKIIIITIVMIFLGCKEQENKENISLSKICKESNNLCKKLTADHLCINLRREVIVNNYFANKEKELEKKEKHQYELLVNLENFVSCSEKASFIEYDYKKMERRDKENKKTGLLTKKEIETRNNFKEDLRKRDTDRKTNYIFSTYMLRGLNRKTKNSNNPYLLYWHWSRNGNNEAILKLEKMHENNQIDSYRMNYYLSLHYATFDKEKSIDLMFSSLEKLPIKEYVDKESNDDLPNNNSIHFSIFKSLVTYYYNKKDFEKSYIFAKLLEEKNDKSADIYKIIKYFEANKKSKIISRAEDKVELINKKLEKGAFRKNLL
jgi:hypothetical protein